MPFRLRREWHAFRHGLRRLDRQATVVLVAAVVLVLLQLQVGNRAFFADHVAADPADARELAGWAWWFGMQGLLGFVVPVLVLILGFWRRPSEIGLGLGDWKLAGALALAYAVPVLVGTWVLSSGADFQAQYPHLDAAQDDWGVFLAYEALFVFYWVGWEYLWRGFVLFGTAHTFGVHAVFVQAVPFALLHLNKPLAEALLSIVGGVALGALVWRCRSFWIAVPIHAAQMIILDFWCTLRIRTGVSGIDPAALVALFRAWLA